MALCEDSREPHSQQAPCLSTSNAEEVASVMQGSEGGRNRKKDVLACLSLLGFKRNLIFFTSQDCWSHFQV